MGVIGTAVLTGLAGSVASTVLGKVLGGKDDNPPPAPTPTAPTVMPTADDASVQAARKKSIADQTHRQGRASTILTSDQDTSDKLGG